MNKYVLFFWVIIITISCKSDDQNPLSDFTKSYYIKHNKLQIDPVKLVSFGRLLLFEKDKLLIKENFQGETLLSKIYYEKDSIIPLIKKGNGPHELLMPRIMQKKCDSSLYILDIAQSLFKFCSLK